MAILTSYVQLTKMCVLLHKSLILFHSCSFRFCCWFWWTDLPPVWWPLKNSIAPEFINTLNVLTQKNSATTLYGWKQSASKMLAVQIAMMCRLTFVLCLLYLSSPLLSSRFLGKPYICSPSMQVELQLIELIVTVWTIAKPRTAALYTSLMNPCQHRKSSKVSF